MNFILIENFSKWLHGSLQENSMQIIQIKTEFSTHGMILHTIIHLKILIHLLVDSQNIFFSIYINSDKY